MKEEELYEENSVSNIIHSVTLNKI